MKLLALASFTVLSAVAATTALGSTHWSGATTSCGGGSCRGDNEAAVLHHGGSAQPPVFATPIAMATTRQAYSIKVEKPSDVLVVRVRVAPGGTFGWHSHPSAVAVAVTSGTLTLYDSGDPSCSAKRFSGGQGFVEAPNHVHLARNEGTTPVTLYATYLGIPRGATPNAPALEPVNCPARGRTEP